MASTRTLSRESRDATDETITASEEEFYSSYEWCLNPALSLRELITRTREEIDRYPSLRRSWQREESRVNLYLFASAIACTTDDFLAGDRPGLSKLSRRWPRLRIPLSVLRALLDAERWVRNLCLHGRVSRWRRRWNRCLDAVCEILVREPDAAEEQVGDWGREARVLLDARLPRGLLRCRMRVPQGLRGEDLTHWDALSLARDFDAENTDREGPLLVLGLRTAGAYFAPLVRAQLSALGRRPVSWMTIRPKGGLSIWEVRRLAWARRVKASVLVVDDYPNTGWTFLRTLELLQRAAIPPRRITLLAPLHPSRANWTLPRAGTAEQVSVLIREPRDLYKSRVLTDGSAGSLLEQYYRSLGWKAARVHGSRSVDRINARLEERGRELDALHVRRKRVFEVVLSRHGQAPTFRRVLGKSVGWGWLGYHGYLCASRLPGLVPNLLGQRHGLLFLEWVGETGPDGETVAARPSPARVARYVGARVRKLPLSEDPGLDKKAYRWTAWDVMAEALRGAYGPYLGRWKRRDLRSRLQEDYRTALPTLVDGRMGREEWIGAVGEPLKIDFEQHNFGGAELDVVDPAYDLAAAICEFRLSPEDEEELLETYSRASGDESVRERLLPYELLYGYVALRMTAASLACSLPERRMRELNERHLATRHFLTDRMNRFCAGLLAPPGPAGWSKRLFFMDLDGVFDREIFGFPHTTAAGLRALALLRSNAFSIVLNTGRSAPEVRRYCDRYGLAGGVAEFGGVFINAIERSEHSLTTPDAAAQVRDCRELVQRVPGVFCDPYYRHSVRTYRYRGGRTAGLDASEAQEFLSRHGLDRLAFVARSADTYFVAKGSNKGTGMAAALRHLGSGHEPVASIGDSDEDLPMLAITQYSYAPSNCSMRLRRAGRKGGFRILARPFQRGLLAAVHDLLRERGSAPRERARPEDLFRPNDLIGRLLWITDEGPLRAFLSRP